MCMFECMWGSRCVCVCKCVCMCVGMCTCVLYTYICWCMCVHVCCVCSICMSVYECMIGRLCEFMGECVFYLQHPDSLVWSELSSRRVQICVHYGPDTRRFENPYLFVQWRPDGDSDPKSHHFMWVFTLSVHFICAFHSIISCRYIICCLVISYYYYLALPRMFHFKLYSMFNYCSFKIFIDNGSYVYTFTVYGINIYPGDWESLFIDFDIFGFIWSANTWFGCWFMLE